MLRNNPNSKEIYRAIEESGGDIEKAFRKKAQEMGVNPEDVINMLK